MLRTPGKSDAGAAQRIVFGAHRLGLSMMVAALVWAALTLTRQPAAPGSLET